MYPCFEPSPWKCPAKSAIETKTYAFIQTKKTPNTAYLNGYYLEPIAS